MESSFVKIKLPPVSPDSKIPANFDLSPSYISSVDSEFTRVYEEYTRRLAAVQQLGEEIVKLWAELGTPQAQTETTIVQHWRDNPEQLGLHQDDVTKLKTRRDKLQEEKRVRERKLKDLKSSVEGLWDRLCIEERDRKAFLATTRGCGLRAINDLEDELSRLNDLKKQNLHLFVEDARQKLQALWDELYFSEEDAIEFTPMFCGMSFCALYLSHTNRHVLDVFSDALLSAHESEISRLEALKQQRQPTLQLIAKHRSILKDKEDLAASSQDASRLLATKGAKGEKRDPTRLLREEKMRKRIGRELPKVEQDLTQMLETYEEEYGRPYMVFGERYLDVIEASGARAPPTRSKTPSGLPPRPGTAQALRAPPQQSRDTTRAKSKTPAPVPARNAVPSASGTLSRYPLASTTKIPVTGGTSPSRIPLSSMPNGGNSPERTQPQRANRGQENGNVQRIGNAPMMAPPPKMRDLQSMQNPVATPVSTYSEDVYRSGSVVRNMPPEDPYNDQIHFGSSRQAQQQQASHAMLPPSRPACNGPRAHYDLQQGAYHVDHSTTASTASRQISNSSIAASAASTATSASENWETYGDSECEDPALSQQDTYAASMRNAVGTKRAHPGAGEHFNQNTSYSPHQAYGDKKLRGVDGPVRNGSNEAWIDEETF